MRKKVRINFEKASSLLMMAKISLERLNSFDKMKYPSNTLNDYYDILHKLMDGFAISKGVKFVGENAHKELINYICGELFTLQDKEFLQRIRQFRNQIAYEGFNINEDFLRRNMKRIEEHGSGEIL
jgi:hypothetical protein